VSALGRVSQNFPELRIGVTVDVFICHALRDRGFVGALCKSLESAQVKIGK
jgi:hypothetical protein